jgi:hypothetical protein
MINVLSFESFSKIVPPFEMPIDISNIGEELTSKLIKIIEDEEENVKNITKPFTNKLKNNENPDEVYGLEDWVTNRAFEYNLLKMTDKYPELLILKNKILEQYNQYCDALQLEKVTPYVQVWFNVLRKDSRFFTKHNHAHKARIGNALKPHVSGNICIRAQNTKTYYYSPYVEVHRIGVDNVAGDMVLFPSWATHSTDQNKDDEPRLSIAFDVISEEAYTEGKMDNPENYIPL